MHHLVIAESATYTVSSDDPPSLGGRTWGLVGAHLVDETTGEPPRGRVTVQCAQPGLAPSVAGNGFAGLVGVPQDALSLLATTSYVFDVTFIADGYLPAPVSVTVPLDLTFPVTFTPVQLGDLSLHRQPVVVQGRTVLAAAGATAPIPGATVAITGIWNTPPPANIAVPPSPPNLLSLSPPLYFPRTAGTGKLRRREMVPVIGADKMLVAWANLGDTALQLSDRVGLSVGDLLVIDEIDPDLTEYLPVIAIAGFSTPAQPATITTACPLASRHPFGAVVRKVTPQPPGPNRQCSRDSIAGDTCFFLTTLSGLAAVHVAEISGGVPPAEYHALRRFYATSDVQGYFRLPPLSRVAQVEVQATDGVHAPVKIVYSPDYTESENRIDFVFR